MFNTKIKEFYAGLVSSILHNAMAYVGFSCGIEIFQIILTTCYVFSLIVILLSIIASLYFDISPIDSLLNFNDRLIMNIMDVTPIMIMVVSGFNKEAALYLFVFVGMKAVNKIRGGKII